MHRDALKTARDNSTRLTNLFSGRPARGIVNRLMRDRAPINAQAPTFPMATGAITPLRAAAEAAAAAIFRREAREDD